MILTIICRLVAAGIGRDRQVYHSSGRKRAWVLGSGREAGLFGWKVPPGVDSGFITLFCY